MRNLISSMFVAAIAAACTIQLDPKSSNVEPDDSDTVAIDSRGSDTDFVGPYIVSGRLNGHPMKMNDAEWAYVIVLSAVNGSLFSDPYGFTTIRCVNFNCSELRHDDTAEFLCRVGDPNDWTRREICTRLVLPADSDSDQDTDAADPSETDDDEADSDLPTDKDPPPAP